MSRTNSKFGVPLHKPLLPTTFQAEGLAAIAGLRCMVAPTLLSRGKIEGFQSTPFAALGAQRFRPHYSC
jgi:hypothetical protein